MKVIFVCTGNICRSPMAEGLFAHQVKDYPGIEVGSAGIGAMTGQSPSSHSIEVMDELGIDIRSQRSEQLTSELIAETDLIFVMTYSHLDAILMQFPEASEKTFLVREFVPGLSAIDREVPDPIGQARDVYRYTRDQIQEGLLSVLEVVLKVQAKLEGPDAAMAQGRAPVVSLAVDSSISSSGEAVGSWLREKGFEVAEAAQASGSAQALASGVARRVVDQLADFGLVLLAGAGPAHRADAATVAGARPALARTAVAARLSREALDANVLCIEAADMSTALLKEIVAAWLYTPYKDQSQHQKNSQMESATDSASFTFPSLREVDPEIFAVIENERQRQTENIELIASENFTSPAVMQAQGSCLTNKYAEGYPGKRWYGGCEFADVAEQLAIDRAKELFGAEHANVQPHSGSQANTAVYFSVLDPDDTILTMDLSHGGHLTHGHKMNFSGRFYNVVHYGVSAEFETIDYNALAEQAQECRPKMITAGASAYSRIIDFKRMREIADSVGAYLFVDMAHIAGLVAAGAHPSPVGIADFVTTTTHKTLRGPRGGLILCGEKHAKAIDSQVFPGIQGGPLMHVIAAKAVCFAEALRPEFKTYQEQVARNAKALCEGMKKNGYRIVSGTTENHCMLVDLQPKDITGKKAQETLDQAGITVNKNAIPFDKQSPFKAGGIRLGSPAVTTRGMKEDEMFDIADMIHSALENRDSAEPLAKIREKVREMTTRFPLPQ